MINDEFTGLLPTIVPTNYVLPYRTVRNPLRVESLDL